MTWAQWLYGYLLVGLLIAAPFGAADADGVWDFLGMCLFAALLGVPMVCLFVPTVLYEYARKWFTRTRA